MPDLVAALKEFEALLAGQHVEYFRGQWWLKDVVGWATISTESLIARLRELKEKSNERLSQCQPQG